MRSLLPGVSDPYGSGRNTFERERRAVLLAGYRVVPTAELTVGEQHQASRGLVIETLADSAYPYDHGHLGVGAFYEVPAGSRYTLDVAIEPDRGEE